MSNEWLEPVDAEATANLPEVCCSYMEGHPAKVGWPFLLFRAITV